MLQGNVMWVQSSESQVFTEYFDYDPKKDVGPKPKLVDETDSSERWERDFEGTTRDDPVEVKFYDSRTPVDARGWKEELSPEEIAADLEDPESDFEDVGTGKRQPSQLPPRKSTTSFYSWRPMRRGGPRRRRGLDPLSCRSSRRS